METREQAASRPRYNPLHDEWSLRTGPNTWLVWKHGTMPGDAERWLAEAEAELAHEQRTEAQGEAASSLF